MQVEPAMHLGWERIDNKWITSSDFKTHPSVKKRRKKLQREKSKNRMALSIKKELCISYKTCEMALKGKADFWFWTTDYPISFTSLKALSVLDLKGGVGVTWMDLLEGRAYIGDNCTFAS